MKKLNIKKLLALAAAVVLLVGVLWIADVFTGYPVSHFRVKRAAENYLEENYPGMELTLSRPERQLKLGGFTMEAASPNDPLLHFRLQFWTDGTLAYDTYEDDVVSKGNIFGFLNDEYNRRCHEIWAENDLPWPSVCIGSFRDAHEPDSGVEPLDTRTLTMDDQYNLGSLSAKYGSVQLQITTDEVNVDTACQALLTAREVMERAALPFRSAEVFVQSETQKEDGSYAQELHIRCIAWEDIVEDGLSERVSAALDRDR